MRVLIAPDSFKHCLTQAEAAQAMAEGVRAVWPQAEIQTLPLADGGEGTMRIVTDYLSGRYSQPTTGYNALRQPKTTHYGVLDSGVAITDAAETIGIEHIAKADLNIWQTSSYGLGAQLAEIYQAGFRKVLIGLGSTACADAGKGLREAFQEHLRASAPSAMNGELADMQIIALTDVQNPLCGKTGAARVFAPQKGATLADVEQLEAEFQALAAQYPEAAQTAGAGAGGGLGFALKAYYNAQIVSGADYILNLFDIDNLLKDCDLVLTGEGKMDAQTLLGKAPYALMRHAQKQGIPTIAFAGQVEQPDQLLTAGFHAVHAITPPNTPTPTALNKSFAIQQLSLCVSSRLRVFA